MQLYRGVRFQYTSPGYQNLCAHINKTVYVTLNSFPSNCAHFSCIFSSRFIFELSLIRQVDQTNFLR